MRLARVLYLSLAAVLIVTGCSSDDGSEDAKSDSDSVDFGEPADSTDADRVIEIEANDDFGFDPDTLEVEAGEVVTFSVTNVGDLDHDFTLGPVEVQEAHEAEMAEMGEMDEMEASDHGEDPNAISIPPGATEELTWRFTRTGEVLMGCHTEGHWAKGMRGEIDVVEPA